MVNLFFLTFLLKCKLTTARLGDHKDVSSPSLWARNINIEFSQQLDIVVINIYIFP